MKNTLTNYISLYKECLKEGNIQKAYAGLIKYVMRLKAHLSRTRKDEFVFGNISLGYMDYTYFPFYNEFLKNKKLRFGIILNHSELRFELWLMGQNAETQRKYWEILKSTKWNKNQAKMPVYSVLEVVLIENPDFDNLDILTENIEKNVIHISGEIIQDLQDILK